MIPNSFFQRFVQYDTKGAVDVKKSMKSFEEAFTSWVKEQSDIKPAILAELENYGKLGEGELIYYVTHALKLRPTKENVERVQSGLAELAKAGKISYKTNENGQRKGRGTGWQLKEAAA